MIPTPHSLSRIRPLTTQDTDGTGATTIDYTVAEGKATSLSFKGFFQNKTGALQQTREGAIVRSSAMIYINKEVDIKADDLVPWNGEQYLVLDAKKKVDSAGRFHHMEVPLIKDSRYA